MLKHLLIAACLLFVTSCEPSGSYEPMDCNPLGYADLDATWRAYAYKHTFVSWPETDKTEVRESEGPVTIIGDQCGSHLVFFGAVGKVDTDGAKLHIGDITNVNFEGLKYTVSGYGYTSQDMGWLTVKQDFGFVVYDTDWTFDLIEKRFE